MTCNRRLNVNTLSKCAKYERNLLKYMNEEISLQTIRLILSAFDP